MSGGYQRLYEWFPEFLKRRINPLEYAIRGLVAEAADGSHRSRILDAGAGESRFRDLFAQHHYVTVDLAVGAIDWDYSGLDVIGDLQQLPLASNVFDRVVSTQVLEHVPSPERMLGEVLRVLRPGGRLYLSAPQGWHEHQQPHDFFRFTQFSLRRMLDAVGFEQIEIVPMGGFFHFLGHRLTYIPKVLFADRRGWPRLLLAPLELFSLFLFCFLCPVLCYYLDSLDRKQEFTLGYACRAVKSF